MTTKKKSKKNERLFIALEVDVDQTHARHGIHNEVFVNGTIDCVLQNFDNRSSEGDESAVYELKLVGYMSKGAAEFTPLSKR